MPDQNRNPPGFISPEPEAEAAQARRQARRAPERFVEHETEPRFLPKLPTAAGVGEFGQTIFQAAGIPEHVGLAAATVPEVDQVARQVFVSIRDDDRGGGKTHLVDFSTPFAGISLEGSEDMSDVEQFQVMELEARSAQLTEARLIEGELEPEIAELEFAGTPEIAASVVRMKHEIEEHDSVASATNVSFGDVDVRVSGSDVLVDGVRRQPQYTAVDFGALKHAVSRLGVSVDGGVEQLPQSTAVDFGVLVGSVKKSGVVFPQTEALPFVSSALDVSSQLFEIPSPFISPREPEAEPGDVLSRVRPASQLTSDADTTQTSYNFSRGASSFTVR